MAGKLYIVATPIGNLEDITLRALRVLREVDLIAAEDTRTTGRLLAHYEIENSMISLHEYNEEGRVERILNVLQTGDVALVSESGTPSISDPGFSVIRAAIEAGVQVVPIPGPSALISALVASGLPTDSFVYLGFLPRRRVARRRLLESLTDQPRTLIAYEAPHRLLETLSDIVDLLGDRRIVVAREMTKLHEEFWRGSAISALEHFIRDPPRGEITLVIAGAKGKDTRWDEDAVRRALRDRLDAGADRKGAAKEIAALSGWSRRDVYRLSLELDDKT